ncbi:MAG TPA: hypothetical protein P5159_16795 [Phycisphaerae bacterium]|nr:hypothetical protein [Phycisphaerae bacterium]
MASGKESKHAWLRALGGNDMPARIALADGEYEHRRTYKHDFFAATGLYRGPAGLAVLKLGRTAKLFGLPMAWLGRMLADHELAVYAAANGVEGVPRCLGRWGRTGLIHVFVEGHPLQRYERVDDAFFGRLEQLLDELHRRDIAYVDLEKRENILVDHSGRPSLIDFQISWQWPATGRRQGVQRIVPGFLGRFVLRRLQAADRYHLRKHQRRHRPDTLTAEQLAASHQTGILIVLHRWLSWPFTATRRMILKRVTGRSRSAKQDGPSFLEEVENGASRMERE